MVGHGLSIIQTSVWANPNWYFGSDLLKNLVLRLFLVLQVDTAVAEETRNAVQAEEMKAKVKAETAQAIADDAQKDLAEALPALDAALASLRNLNKNDVTEVIK